ncbi:hypothetical protein FACS1894187_12520 [Synergistales bacterium]|nr:hypothetical protein FACS1894187_12520 [Synergistales bacterium]
MEPTSNYSVLIVDDERANLLLLNQILSGEYRVFTAKSGAEALSRAENESPDLILLDIMMPDMSGFDVLKQLKEDPATQDIPVIIVTGLTGTDDEEKGFSLGAVDYITKPFKEAIVKARVKTHMRILDQIRTLERLGFSDPLTKLANRRNFGRRLALEWRKAIRDRALISFLMMDLDKFKNYNDFYGHTQGDILLKRAARVLSEIASSSSDLAARLGGEEFGLLMPGVNATNALAIAEKIRLDIGTMRVPTIDGSKVITSITISIGVNTITPVKNDSPKDFISKTYECLIAAKAAGRNRVVSDLK